MRFRRNADEDLRTLERRAASGDADAQEALLPALVRAGKLDQASSLAADVLINRSQGRLPIPVIRRLHEELMEYDLMEKLGVYATLQHHPGGLLVTSGIFGTETRAFAGAAAEGANVAARHRLFQLAEQMEELLEQGYEFLNQEDDARARAAFSAALQLFNTSVPNAQIAVQRLSIE